MTKHHKFSQLTENFSQERQAEIAQKTDKLKAEITLHELRLIRKTVHNCLASRES
jgi:hypothetical protein